MPAIDWSAVSAIATSLAALGTFLAVAVALWPIIGQAIERRATARNLRGRLIAESVLIRPFILGRSTGSYVADEETRAALDALDEMCRQASVLSPLENDLLLALVANLKFFRRHGTTIGTKTALEVNATLTKLVEELERRGFRQSRGTLPLPWESDAEGPMSGESLEGWLRCQQWLLNYRKRWSLARLFSDAGPYLVTMWVALNVAAFVISADWLTDSSWRWILSIPCLFTAIYYVVDSVLVNTSIAFIDPYPRLLLRSVLFTFFAFWNVSIAFAVLYVAASSAFTEPLTYPMALYFSVATVTTLGEPTIVPIAWPAHLLVCAQLIIGLYFLGVVLSIIVSWSAAAAKSLPPAPKG